nr:reverse transcriptase domain-containing protein [Tanacetum cinerariifolium]
MTAILKQFQAPPPPAFVKSVEEICVTCGGAHPYYQCLAADGNTFLKFQDNIQGYVSAVAVNYNQGNSGYRPLSQDKDEIQIPKFWQMFKQLHINITLADALILIPKYQKMLKALLSNKEKLLELANTPLNENCLAVILKKLLEKLRDPGKFLIPCGFSELKCKALADLEVINPLSGNPTSSSLYQLLEEFADELALITFPLRNDDLPFDIESDLRETEYLLNHDPTKEMNSILEDSIDECNLADPDNDLVELEFDNDDVYDDPFDSKEDKIKESKLLIDELDPPISSDFLPSPEYDSFLFEDFSEVDALPLTDNEDKVFN